MPPDYGQQLQTATAIIRRVARRNAINVDEADDFQSWATVKLIENDYAAFRKFQGRSKLSTYLTTVVTRLFLDYRDSKWSKWRNSAPAKRLGLAAMQLECLVYRDEHSFTDAVVIMREQLGTKETDAELEQLFSQLNPRYRRRFEGEDTVGEIASPTRSPEEETEAQERSPQAASVSAAVTKALAGLDSQDGLILKLRFADGMKLVDIARLLGIEQRALYGRVETLLRQLKTAITSSGISASDIRDVLGWDELDLGIDFPMETDPVTVAK